MQYISEIRNVFQEGNTSDTIAMEAMAGNGNDELCIMGLCTVTAEAAPKASSVALNKTKLTVDMDDRTTYQLKAVVSPKSASQKVRWTTSNSSVATVSSSGKVTFKKAGQGDHQGHLGEQQQKV